MGKPSLFHLLVQSLKEQCRFGTSKHAVKEEIGWKPGQALPGLWGVETYKGYRKVCHRFSVWCRLRGVRGDWEAAKELVQDFLRECRDAGLSADTLRLYRAALRKAFRDPELAGEVKLPARRKDAIKRSREPREMDRHVDLERWRDVVDFARATGLRRKELGEVRAADVFMSGSRLMVRVRRGKGGQPRVVHVLERFRDRVMETVQCRDPEEVLFPRIPTRLDIHSLRREYAAERLREEEAACPDRPRSELLMRVSEDLGHHRTNVVVRHYLPRRIPGEASREGNCSGLWERPGVLPGFR